MRSLARRAGRRGTHPLRRLTELAVARTAAIVFPVALRVLPFRWVLRGADRIPVVMSAGWTPPQLARRVHRWMERWRGPWRSTCLSRSVVLYALLRQHGHRPRLHIGARGTPASFVGHAWISVDGAPLLEPSPLASGYHELLAHEG